MATLQQTAALHNKLKLKNRNSVKENEMVKMLPITTRLWLVPVLFSVCFSRVQKLLETRLQIFSGVLDNASSELRILKSLLLPLMHILLFWSFVGGTSPIQKDQDVRHLDGYFVNFHKKRYHLRRGNLNREGSSIRLNCKQICRAFSELMIDVGGPDHCGWCHPQTGQACVV